MLRSEVMSFCTMYLQVETAFDAVAQLGEVGHVQILETNEDVPISDRAYTTDMCRCVAIEAKLLYMEKEIMDQSYPMFQPREEPPPLQLTEITPFEQLIDKWEKDIREMTANHAVLMNNYLELVEMSYVMTQIDLMIGTAEMLRDPRLNTGVGGGEMGVGGHLFVIVGAINRTRLYAFEVMLWRISKTNVLVKTSTADKALEDSVTGNIVIKTAFFILCQGEELRNRIMKVCNGFRASTYECPRTFNDRNSIIVKLFTRTEDISQVILKTRYQRCKALRHIAKFIRTWMISVKKTVAVCHNLNLFCMSITKECLLAECWVAKSRLSSVQKSLNDISQKEISRASFITECESDEYAIPPTSFRTNKFTKGFQELINAYGDPQYREINPGLFTVISFPFLFAVMFGDLGHGIIVFLFGLWMVVYEKKLEAMRINNEIFSLFFMGRYIILLMGLFSMYTGFLYNDIFSKAFALGSSGWKCNSDQEHLSTHRKNIELERDPTHQHIYWAGVDPVWRAATNQIIHDNSLKMKMSIIIAVLHMMFGLFLSLLNHIHYRHYHAIFLEYIPQTLFLASLFGWLVFMIFYKWFHYTKYSDETKWSHGCAPLLLIYFIDMVLQKDTPSLGPQCDAFMFASQRSWQKVLVVLSVVMIPIMMFGSPIWVSYFKLHRRISLPKSGFRRWHGVKKHHSQGYHPHEKLSFGDLLMNQGVHTIEFVLSTISHTASYLRLWALSLAHAALSEMLWTMVLSNIALRDHSVGGALKTYFVFAIWAFFTLSILVVMEGLSAFLHTLRLHWVEFMSKFFIGGGNSFRPFSFKMIIDNEAAEHRYRSNCAKFGKKKKVV